MDEQTARIEIEHLVVRIKQAIDIDLPEIKVSVSEVDANFIFVEAVKMIAAREMQIDEMLELGAVKPEPPKPCAVCSARIDNLETKVNTLKERMSLMDMQITILHRKGGAS